MKQIRIRVKVRRPTKDDDLRAAHERAFERIGTALHDPRRSTEIAAAIEELIDACERYVSS